MATLAKARGVYSTWQEMRPEKFSNACVTSFSELRFKFCFSEADDGSYGGAISYAEQWPALVRMTFALKEAIPFAHDL